MEKKTNVISLEIGDGFRQHRPFPFEGRMATLRIGRLTPTDPYIAPHCFAEVVPNHETRKIVVAIYRPVLPGRKSGNILLFKITIDADDNTYSLISYYPTKYKRITLIVTRG